MRRRQAVTVLSGGIIVILALVIGIAFHYGSADARAEWKARMPAAARSARELRGLVDNMIRFRHETVPAFVPMSSWDDEVCAANIEGAINLLLGEERFRTAPAWLFEKVNAGEVRRVYDRSQDFKIDRSGGKITEARDRRVWLSRIVETIGHNSDLTTDRLYVVGYRYRYTVSNDKIIAALEQGGTVNSHLMLLLGRNRGKWWGYHLLHDKDNPRVNPFLISDLGEEMPEQFDLTHVWEVLNSQMAAKGQGADVMFVQNSPPYASIAPVLHWLGNTTVGYVLDTVMARLFGRGEQFARVIPAVSEGVAEVVPPGSSGWHSQILGFYRGVAVRRHMAGRTRGAYGLEFQCVELVNRFYARILRHRNMAGSGHADSYFADDKAKGLQAFRNGAPAPPRADDILVFDAPKNPGHAAIVVRVSEDSVCVIQQNTPAWRQCLPLWWESGGWKVPPITEDLPCMGWARRAP